MRNRHVVIPKLNAAGGGETTFEEVHVQGALPQKAPSQQVPSQRGPVQQAPAQAFPFQQLDVYRAARELAVRVERMDIRDAELRDQATRAAKSTFLNLGEGLPDDRAAMRRKYFAQADGSLHEAVAAVDLAAAIGAVARHRADEALAVAGRVRAMIRGLLRAGTGG